MATHEEKMDAITDYHAASICTDIENEALDEIIAEAGSKRIHTSYYARSGEHPNAIGISASVPKGFTGPHMTVLAPSWDLLERYKKGEMTKMQYADEYITLLESRNLTPQIIYDSIPHAAILLCYEKPGEFCHRRVLAEWLEINLKVRIDEWVSDEERKKEEFVDELLKF